MEGITRRDLLAANAPAVPQEWFLRTFKYNVPCPPEFALTDIPALFVDNVRGWSKDPELTLCEYIQASWSTFAESVLTAEETDYLKSVEAAYWKASEERAAWFAASGAAPGLAWPYAYADAVIAADNERTGNPNSEVQNEPSSQPKFDSREVV